MSDEDELGGFNPTTPFKPVPTKKPTARKPNSRTAGSSTKPASNGVSTKKKVGRKSSESTDILSGGEDDVRIVDPSEGDEEEPPAAEPPAAKGKGRKADARAVDAMEVDAVETIEDTEDEEEQALPQKPPASGQATRSTTAVPPPRRAKEDSVSRREFDRVLKQLEQITSQRDQLSKQLEELFSIRRTEPEETLELSNEVFENKLMAQKELINELTSRLERVEPLINEEKQGIRKEMLDLERIIKEREKTITGKDQFISELRQNAVVLNQELKAEIERSKTLLERPRGLPSMAGSNSKPSSFNDPHRSATIKLYEDATNFLIVGAKITEGSVPGTDSVTFHCVFSSGEPSHSLNFTLQTFWIPRADAQEPYTSASDFDEQVKYTPQQLDKESEQFVERLDFLKDTFTFSRNQLDVLLKTLGDTMAGQSQEENEDVELVE
ncbi:hypothetical protein EW146_g3639 [Bondarzewia mesenterica]|uniref:Monopolin complex subunit Csm1/Pcs1 C-terminal domain-containing protein n=1 Tax=Bondarzewia mesenterica TaxID=1095465 RepID=A0A4S4LYT7_9AGAM|nr:hypothetical protein EW146_g3639 [Bondarzewia mesenterica]